MTQRARRRHRRSRGSVRRKLLVVFGVLFAMVLLAVGGLAAWVYSVAQGTPNINHLKPIHQGSNSQIFAADGTRLGYIHSDTLRQPVKSGQIPKLLKEATVAIEDRNFYEHGGIDPAAIVRAAFADVKAGAPVQGGSTITQQLVRNLYIQNPQEDIQRKIQEAVMADQLESKHSKQWILTKYLNTASYGTTDGQTAVGVEAAAQTYFAKGAKDLTLPEAALIAGLPQAPSEYNPLQSPQAALQRRNEVLQALAAAGLHQPQGLRECSAERARPRPGLQVPAGQTAVLLRLRPAAADRQVRRQHRPERRPQGLHDDQLGAPGRRPERRRLLFCLLLGRRPAGGARLGRRHERPHPCDGLLHAVLGQLPVQLRGRRPPPARVLVQALRACHRHAAGNRTPTPPTTPARAR